MRDRLEALVLALCSSECAGRRTGTRGGLHARELVRQALVHAGLSPVEQAIPGIGGANLVATLEGSGPLADRTIVVGAHYDHLGTDDGLVYHGADDNAAAVAILVEVARELAHSRGAGRRIVLVAFDAEEPPFFLGQAMGSEVLAASGLVALDSIDAMIALDLVGHSIGPEGLPGQVRDSVFVLGGESSEGLGALVDAQRAELPLRRVDADVIPPLSDYEPFRRRGVPFLFFTCGRSRVYHTPEDLPAGLAWAKMESLAKTLAALVRDLASDAPRAGFKRGAHDDRATIATLVSLAQALEPFSPAARPARELGERLSTVLAKRRLDQDERARLASTLLAFEIGPRMSRPNGLMPKAWHVSACIGGVAAAVAFRSGVGGLAGALAGAGLALGAQRVADLWYVHSSASRWRRRVTWGSSQLISSTALRSWPHSRVNG